MQDEPIFNLSRMSLNLLEISRWRRLCFNPNLSSCNGTGMHIHRMEGPRTGLVLLLACALAGLGACDEGGGGATADASGGVDFSDADPNAPDAGPSAGCTASGSQCNNCLDDDGDGLFDGNDPECTGLIDDDESSFETGIPGDNIDDKIQDCFFDGNSGAGDDKCKFHTCCILDLMGGSCPAELQPPNFNPADCVVTQSCIANCAPLTPPGCDCFGCCTVCDGATCRDIFTNPAVAPDCTIDVLTDQTKCPACIKTEECGTDCNPLECILCPGQTPEDLPDECNGNPTCPDGIAPCTQTADCLAGEYCTNGCCIEGIG
jgi:hypothetical protein